MPPASASSEARPEASGVVRLLRTDLPRRARQPVLDAVRTLHRGIVLEGGKSESSAGRRKESNNSKVERWEEFALAIQASLNNSSGLGTGWNVVIGETVGFACKKRTGRFATFRVDGALILLWRSPGLENLDERPSEEVADADTSNPPPSGDADAEALGSRKLRVLLPDGDSNENNPIIATISCAIRPVAAELDVQKVAQEIRKRLTDEHGTIWHVLVGKKLLVVQPPEGSELHVRVVVEGKVPMRIECYKHHQFDGGAIDLETIFSAAPYLVLMIFCFAYMTFYSICDEGKEVTTGLRLKIKNNLCVDGWDRFLNSAGAMTIVVFFASKKSYKFFRKVKES